MDKAITPWNNYNRALGTAAFGAATRIIPEMIRRSFRGLGGRPLNAQQRSRAGRIRLNTRTRLRFRTQTRRTGTLGGTNASARMVYKKKSMPKRKKRQWRRFAKKVNAISEKELGLQTLVINDQIESINQVNGEQGCLTLGLYTMTNGTNGWLNDMNRLGTLDNTGNPTAAAGTTVNSNTSVIFQSAIQDLTIRNASTLRQNVSGVETDLIAPEAQMELDVYELSVRKEMEDIGTILTSLSAALNSYDAPEIGGTGTGYAINDRGVSPFEMSPALSRWGIKIWKKTKYFIPGSATITHQIRDPKRRVMKYGDLTRAGSFNEPGVTKFLFLIYKLVPGFTLGTSVNTYKCRLLIGSTRKYGYKVEGRNEPRERLTGATYVSIGPA